MKKIETQITAVLYKAGYRVKLEIDGAEPLYTKTIADAANLVRTSYKDCSFVASYITINGFAVALTGGVMAERS